MLWFTQRRHDGHRDRRRLSLLMPIATITAGVFVAGCGATKVVTVSAPTPTQTRTMNRSPSPARLDRSDSARVGAALVGITRYCSSADRIRVANMSQAAGIAISSSVTGLKVPSEVRSLVAVYRASPTDHYISAGGTSRTMRQVLADASAELDPNSCSDALAAYMRRLDSQPAMVNAGIGQENLGQPLPAAKYAAESYDRLQTELGATA